MPTQNAPSPRPVIATGQQIGAGWTPALSVAKALAALAEAKRLGVEAVYWMADEDHDRAEVASTVGMEKGRLVRHRFRFDAPRGTAAGWLPWGAPQQQEAESLWGEVPAPSEPTLRGHALSLGGPLWRLGLRPFSPTDPASRGTIQGELERWRSLDLEAQLLLSAERLEAEHAPLPLDPRQQAAWFSLNPQTGLRKRLERGEACPKHHWLSPGAALRPLMQSLMLPVEAAVLGPSERAYWRLTEPLWERVGLTAPRILSRPSVFVVPQGCVLNAQRLSDLDALREGDWQAFASPKDRPPSQALGMVVPDPSWGPLLGARFTQELDRARHRLERLDRRRIRDLAAETFNMDPERLRQRLFPFGKAQERVLPGLFWLRDETLIRRIFESMDGDRSLILLEES
ncbi:MAG: bacillithiol biosynthesis BshC [Acidobacteriota bacterium]|nr:bacillithiol biosynthesis BshC [Acidobacteriota bacterium]